MVKTPRFETPFSSNFESAPSLSEERLDQLFPAASQVS